MNENAKRYSILSDDVFENAAMLVCFKQMRISYRISMLGSQNSNAEIEYLKESPEPQNLRPTLDKKRLLDTSDEYLDVLGLPD